MAKFIFDNRPEGGEESPQPKRSQRSRREEVNYEVNNNYLPIPVFQSFF